ncbi:cytochrome c oxidase assembly protein [Bacillus salitolerans]|uniref:Cytochrome c oxidase assembly protein n=1 Tax=Bacillus salitolerans TaxID=1437434 RepID=A0ABW4LRH0_9BACI
MKIKLFYLLCILVAYLSFSPLIGQAHGDSEDHDGFFQHYTFFELWDPLYFLILTFVYIVFINGSRKIMIKKIAFGSGLFTLFLALGSPLHVLGDSYLFSAHMLQQSLVYIVVPPLILYGLQNGETGKWISKVRLGIFKRPLFLLLGFNVLFSFYHIPIIFEYLVQNTIFHSMSHVILTVSAFLMWVPIIPLVKEMDTLTEVQKIGYIFAGGVLLTPACALILFADHTMYPTYITNQPLFPMLPPLDDQQLGGIIMKVAQEIVFCSIIGYIFFNWAKKEQEVDKCVENK